MLSHSYIEDLLLKQKHNPVFENPILGVTITDPSANVLYVNSTHSLITGLECSEWVGKNFYDLVDNGTVSESATLKIIESQKETIVTQLVNTQKAFTVHGFPIFDARNNLRYIISFLIDSPGIQRIISTRPVDGGTIYPHNLSSKCRLIYQSKKMQDVVDCVYAVADATAPVLITGDSGVGKEIVAALVHESSPRQNKPFIKINCNAIPETLLESELFGYESGSFTGANKNGKQGLFEKAHTGTLFLDEIGDMPMNLQVKLLRVLQEGEVPRIGSHKSIKVDVRIVAATNADLLEKIEKKLFREDLYYRLNVIPVRIPNLSERSEDISILIKYFSAIFNQKYGKQKTFDTSAIRKLSEIPLKGNVRQLRNIIERLTLLTKNDTVDEQDIEEFLLQECADYIQSHPTANNTKTHLKNQDMENLRDLYTQYRSSYKISEVIGVNQSTVWRRLKKYGII